MFVPYGAIRWYVVCDCVDREPPRGNFVHCDFLKPHSHCAGVATVHPDAGQPVYRDAPGHIS